MAENRAISANPSNSFLAVAQRPAVANERILYLRAPSTRRTRPLIPGNGREVVGRDYIESAGVVKEAITPASDRFECICRSRSVWCRKAEPSERRFRNTKT